MTRSYTTILTLVKEGIRFHIECLIEENQPVPEEVEHPRILRLNVAA